MHFRSEIRERMKELEGASGATGGSRIHEPEHYGTRQRDPGVITAQEGSLESSGVHTSQLLLEIRDFVA